MNVAGGLDRLGLVVCLALGVLLGAGFAAFDVHPIDAWTYWQAGHGTMYGPTWTEATAYVYPPPLAQVTGLLSWPAFIVPWTVALFASWWAMLRWAALPVLVLGGLAWWAGWDLLAAPVKLLAIGNAQVLVVAGAVVGLRYGAAWAPAILTKMTPGIGWLYLAVRREWRPILVGAAVTGGALAVSVLGSPAAWADYARFAIDNIGTPNYVDTIGVPLLVRLPAAAVLLVVGGRKGWTWTVPVAVGLSAITLYWSALLTALLAVIPLGVPHHRAEDVSEVAAPRDELRVALRRGQG